MITRPYHATGRTYSIELRYSIDPQLALRDPTKYRTGVVEEDGMTSMVLADHDGSLVVAIALEADSLIEAIIAGISESREMIYDLVDGDLEPSPYELNILDLDGLTIALQIPTKREVDRP